jgi:hypothetical protein
MYPGSSKQNKKSLAQLLAEHKGVKKEVVEEVVVRKLDLKDFKGKSLVLPADMKVSEAHSVLEKHPAFRDIPALKIGKAAWKHNYPQINVNRDNRCVVHLYGYYTATKDPHVMEQIEKFVNKYQDYVSQMG